MVLGWSDGNTIATFIAHSPGVAGIPKAALNLAANGAPTTRIHSSEMRIATQYDGNRRKIRLSM